jgi:hypothetical protein
LDKATGHFPQRFSGWIGSKIPPPHLDVNPTIMIPCHTDFQVVWRNLLGPDVRCTIGESQAAQIDGQKPDQEAEKYPQRDQVESIQAYLLSGQLDVYPDVCLYNVIDLHWIQINDRWLT